MPAKTKQPPEEVAEQLVAALLEDIAEDRTVLPGGRTCDLASEYAHQAGCLQYHLGKALSLSMKAQRNLRGYLAFKKQKREGAKS